MEKKLDKRGEILHTLVLLVCAAIWGSAFVAQSVGAEYVGAFTFLAVRNWIAVAFLVPVILVRDTILKKKGRPSLRPANRTQRRFLLMGGVACGFFLCAASAFQQVGIQYTTTAKAGFITALYVVFVPVFAIFFGKKVKNRIWLCVALAVAGLYLLCIREELTLSFGDALVLVCALLFTCQIMTVDYFAPHVDTVRLSQTQFLVTALLSTICMFLFEKPEMESLIMALPSIAYAGVMSSGVAYTLQIIGQQNLNPAIASITMSLESVFAALAGWLILGQAMTTRELSGSVLMFAAILLAQL
ncbi:MAG: DMT family transporter [Lachnospiraceae bacterium]|nr:DMT family transporter [Lachnospiraceae bacterium]